MRGNGNFLERVLGCTTFAASPWLESLRPIVTRALSRRFHGHYRGFAIQQRAQLDAKPTVKRLLYVLRTAATGIHLLRTGRLVIDLRENARELAIDGVDELIAWKREGERVPIPAERIAAWSAALDRLFALLDEAHTSSPLPSEPRNVAEVDAWLVALRRATLAAAP